MITQKIHEVNINLFSDKNNNDSESMKNYKGTYHNKKFDSHSYEAGAHFSYKVLYKKLDFIAKERKLNEENDEQESIITN